MRQAAQADRSGATYYLADRTTGFPARAGTASWTASVLEEGLTATIWLDPGSRGKSYAASVRFSGQRIGSAAGKRQSRDYFSQVEAVDGIVPGSGPVSITARIRGINQGRWRVTAELINPNHGRRARVYPWSRDGGPASVRPTLSYRRQPAFDTVHESVTTGLLAFARFPGVVLGAWPAFVGLGVGVGLALQAMLSARAHLDVGSVLIVSLAASVAGLIGAKAWYLALNHKAGAVSPFEGLCIQGFLIGAVAVGVAALAVMRMPVGSFLDAATPGLFVGMAIGRQGCFFGGCCSGRATASHWGLWASDRRVGARRVPTQLMESLAALAIGLATLAWMLFAYPPIAGAVFAAGVAAYTLARQVLLPLRAQPRKTSIGRWLVVAAAAGVLIAGIVVAALA